MTVTAPDDTTPPTLTVDTPVDATITKNPTVTVSGTATDTGSGLKSLTVNGSAVTPDSTTGKFSTAVTLSDANNGLNEITVIATDKMDLTTTVVRKVTYDHTAPILNVTEPANDSKISTTFITVKGNVLETVKSLTISNKTNGATAGPSWNGLNFEGQLNLVNGVNIIVVTATDFAENSSSETRTVTVDTTKPNVAITSPNADQTTAAVSYPITVSFSDDYSKIKELLITVVDVTTNTTVSSSSINPDIISGSTSTTVSLPTATSNYQVLVTATNELAMTSDTAVRNFIRPTWKPISGLLFYKSAQAFDRINNAYVTLAKVTNTGTAPIAGPLRLIITNPSLIPKNIPGVGLQQNQIGTTTSYSVDILPAGGSLAPGAVLGNFRLNYEVKAAILTFGVTIEQQK